MFLEQIGLMLFQGIVFAISVAEFEINGSSVDLMSVQIRNKNNQIKKFKLGRYSEATVQKILTSKEVIVHFENGLNIHMFLEHITKDLDSKEDWTKAKIIDFCDTSTQK